MKNLSGTVVALTGAASGIGRALAIRLAEQGAELALCDVDEPELLRTAGLADQSPRVTTRVVDVSDRTAVEDFAAAVLRDHGRVDILINNAGVACVASVEDASYDDFTWVLGVNLWGVIHGVKAFLPLLRQRPEAQIVNVASINTFVPFPTNGPYNIAKGGVGALSETLMAELSGTTVAVSCVYPGGVSTGIARRARYTSPADAEGFERRAMTTPDTAARTIIRGMRRGRQRILVGADARVLLIARRCLPMTTFRLIARGWRRQQARDAAAR
ncbi:MAG: SDR family oxidoreductase [Dactylosporangium sp.]|nr:SDR family oxidoreductase [Dactylosporangium sp.]